MGEKKGNWVKAQWNLVLCTALGPALSTRQKENKSPKLIILQFLTFEVQNRSYWVKIRAKRAASLCKPIFVCYIPGSAHSFTAGSAFISGGRDKTQVSHVQHKSPTPLYYLSSSVSGAL